MVCDIILSFCSAHYKKGKKKKPSQTNFHIFMYFTFHCSRYAYTCECTTSALPTCFCLGGRASLGLIVSWSYYAVHLWRSHYKIHKLFRHIRALFNLTSHQLVHHRHVLSPLSFCCIDKINELLSTSKLRRAPTDGTQRQREKLLCKCLIWLLALRTLVCSSCHGMKAAWFKTVINRTKVPNGLFRCHSFSWDLKHFFLN